MIRYALAAIAILYFNAKQTGLAAEDNFAPFISVEAYFISAYRNLANPKALAIGPRGNWASYHTSSKDASIKIALRDCNALLAKDTRPEGKNEKCLLYAVNDKKVWKGPELSPRLGDVLPLPDVPLEKALIKKPSTSEPKGVLLSLHGCDRPQIEPWVQTWIDFFAARAFVVVVPSTFDDDRPGEVCPGIAAATSLDRNIVYRLRIAQTRRTIRQLKILHPKLPIFVWAHSEGGLIVQAVNETVSGIIVSGEACGFFEPWINLIPPSVPVLYLMGERDDGLSDFIQPISTRAIQKRCGGAYQTKRRKWVLVRNADHFTAVWRKEIVTAVSAFLGQKPFDVTARATPKPLDASDQRLKELNGTYKRSATKKAFAVGPNGAMAMSSRWDFEEDAMQQALIDCDRKAAQSPGDEPYAAGGRHQCTIYAIGDRIVAGGKI